MWLKYKEKQAIVNRKLRLVTFLGGGGRAICSSRGLRGLSKFRNVLSLNQVSGHR